MASDISDVRGIDCAWLAVDSLGQVAVFTTAGEGPIPESALQGIESAEELAHALPVRGDAELLAALKRPDDYLSFARRGLFAYDWSDVHRTSAKAIHAYELIARPRSALRVNELPDELGALAASTCLDGIVFGADLHLNPRTSRE